MSDDQLCDLADINSDFLVTGVSGFDSSDVLAGRPFGGCAIFWRRQLDFKAKVIVSGSRRVCCLRLDAEKIKLLLVCIYMPHESDDASTELFVSQLSVVNNLIAANRDCSVIVGGDMNADLSREWQHTMLLRDFCDMAMLFPVITYSLSCIDYTYHFNMLRFNVLDHFLLSGDLFDTCICRVSVMHDIENASDHEPLILHLDVSIARLVLSPSCYTYRPVWSKASREDIENYRSELQACLQRVVIPYQALFCRDALCSNVEHIDSLNRFSAAISTACVDAANISIPIASSGNAGARNGIPGWSEHVNSLRSKSLFWHNVWSDCGRPRNGVVADCMRRARASYHFALRAVRRNSNDIINERFAQALCNHNDRDFWSEARKIRSRQGCRSTIIDGKTSGIDTANLFSGNYQELYTSVAYNERDFEGLKNHVRDLIDKSQPTDYAVFTPHDVQMAIDKLKPDKSDGNNLRSNHFKNAGRELTVYISLLLSGLLMHGSTPDDFVCSRIIPIPKNKLVNVTESSNYRGIALSSLFGKVTDFGQICL